MDLRKLKNYLKCNYNEMEKNCYLMFNDYVISDTHSIICLNNNYNLNIITDKKNNYYQKLKQFRSEFKFETHFFKTLELNFKDKENKFINIDNNYSASIENIKEIKNLIKADKFEVHTVDNLSDKYIIKIENSKTYEVGFLLPCIKY